MEFGLVAGWLACYLVLMRAGQPIAARLLPWHGSGLALPVALAAVWLVTFWVGHLALGPAVWLAVAALVGVALLLERGRETEPLPEGYVESALVFSAAFLFLVAVRAVDPAIVPIGGEKFLDFGLLKALLRAPALPPEDMWFAGRSVSYYYGGHLLAAALARITGTAGRFAYNLALAGFYATLVTAVYGLAGELAARRGTSRRLGAALGAFFVGLAANLLAALQLVVYLVPGADWLARELGYPPTGLAADPASFSYWTASRVISDDPGGFATYDPPAAFVIDEFPLFSWLNGDMHAHMMSTAFTVLVAGLCYAYFRTDGDRRRRRLALLFGAIPAVGGLIAVTNTWSFPTVGGLVVLTVALAPADPRTLIPTSEAGVAGAGSLLPAGLSGVGDIGDEVGRLVAAVLVGAAVLAVALSWSLPFWLTAVTSREIAVLPDRTDLGEFLVVHGQFLVVFAGYLYARGADLLATRRARLGAVGALGLAGVAAGLDLVALGLLAPLIAVVWALSRGPAFDRLVPVRADGGERALGFESVLVVAGAGLVVLVEFVFVKESVGRMNTVFKTYMQVWVLWSVAAGAALAWLLTRWSRWRGTAVRVGAALLLVSTAVYGGFALTNHFTEDGPISRTDDPTLDGTDWLDVREPYGHPGEAKAIRWLDDRSGRPVIVTAAPGGYRWNPAQGKGASAPASLTGLPTVLGWYHEEQYRGTAVYERRLKAVELIYTGAPNQQRTLTRWYDVKYIYVGPAERARYGDITVGNRSWTTVAKRWDEVTIYRVQG